MSSRLAESNQMFFETVSPVVQTGFKLPVWRATAALAEPLASTTSTPGLQDHITMPCQHCSTHLGLYVSVSTVAQLKTKLSAFLIIMTVHCLSTSSELRQLYTTFENIYCNTTEDRHHFTAEN